MTAQALLDELAARGIRVRVVGDRIRLAPPDAIDEPLLAEARRLKPELLRLLAAEISTPAECGWCGGALLPRLFDLVGHPALHCPACHHWTLAGGTA